MSKRLAASPITRVLLANFSMLSISKYNDGNQVRNTAKRRAKNTCVQSTNRNTEIATLRKLA